MPKHTQSDFLTPADLRQHLSTQHKPDLPKQQINQIVEQAVRPIRPVFSHCPLCGKDEHTLIKALKDQASSDETTGDLEPVVATTNILRRHIESHLCELALLGLLPMHDIDSASGYKQPEVESVAGKPVRKGLAELPLPIYDATYEASRGIDNSSVVDPVENASDEPNLAADHLVGEPLQMWEQIHNDIMDRKQNTLMTKEGQAAENEFKHNFSIIQTRRQQAPRAASCYIRRIAASASNNGLMDLTRNLVGLVDVLITSDDSTLGRTCELVFTSTEEAQEALQIIERWVLLSGSPSLKGQAAELRDTLLATLKGIASLIQEESQLGKSQGGCHESLICDILCLRLTRWAKSVGIADLNEQKSRINPAYITLSPDFAKAQLRLSSIHGLSRIDSAGTTDVMSKTPEPPNAEAQTDSRKLTKSEQKVHQLVCDLVELTIEETWPPVAPATDPKHTQIRPLMVILPQTKARIRELIADFPAAHQLQRQLADAEAAHLFQALEPAERDVLQTLTDWDSDLMYSLWKLQGPIRMSSLQNPPNPYYPTSTVPMHRSLSHSIGSSQQARYYDGPTVPGVNDNIPHFPIADTNIASFLQEREARFLAPRTGHRYGKITIKDDAKILMGNGVFDTGTSSIESRSHLYGDIERNEGSVWQGDLPVEDIMAFFKRQ